MQRAQDRQGKDLILCWSAIEMGWLQMNVEEYHKSVCPIALGE